jgi:hypothetical protein
VLSASQLIGILTEVSLFHFSMVVFLTPDVDSFLEEKKRSKPEHGGLQD